MTRSARAERRFSENSSRKEKIRWIERTRESRHAPQCASLARRVSRGIHFYLFRPVTHVAHSNPRAPTRLPRPAAASSHCRISQNLHASRLPLRYSQEISSHSQSMRFSVTNRQLWKRKNPPPCIRLKRTIIRHWSTVREAYIYAGG